MFEEKEYQIKDIIQQYGLSRDMVKYYESHGLIKSTRKANGYRVFDEINMKKLRKILKLRDLGLTVEDIQNYCNSEAISEHRQVIADIRRKTEQEIINLNKRLRKIHEWECYLCENSRFSSGFNAGYQLSLCVDCPHITDSDRKDFIVLDVMEADLKAIEGLTNIRRCELIKNGDLGRDVCVNCKQKQYFKQYYRSRVSLMDKAELDKMIAQTCHELRMQGYHLHPKVYIQNKVVQKDGKDSLISDILLLIIN